MKQITIAMVLGLASLVAAGGPAQAQEPNIPSGEKTFARLDQNKDGKLSLDEARPKVVGRFVRLDGDSDGNVSAAEVELYLKQQMERRRDRILASMDADKDGTISKLEIEGFVSRQFAAADADKDGAVVPQEMKAYYAERRKQAFREMRASRSKGEAKQATDSN
jgi:Ca2+-binding EF-hand superfamily protein